MDGSPTPATPSAPAPRSTRAYEALFHLVGRHADTAARRSRDRHPEVASPDEVVRLTAALAGGSVLPGPGEADVDASDLLAALTLVPQTRAELDSVELTLLRAARGRGLTWADIATGLGLATPQAAQQRNARLEGRVDE